MLFSAFDGNGAGQGLARRVNETTLQAFLLLQWLTVSNQSEQCRTMRNAANIPGFCTSGIDGFAHRDDDVEVI
jgi:hypothetical protein